MVRASALVALVAAGGCTLPVPLGHANRSDNLLHSLLQGEPNKLADTGADGQQETAPYPTAVRPGAQAPLPLQAAGTPQARPLDPQQLAGRLPVRIPSAEEPVSPAPPPPETRESHSPVIVDPAVRPAEYQPIPAPPKVENAPPSPSVSKLLQMMEKSWEPAELPTPDAASTIAQVAAITPAAPPEQQPPLVEQPAADTATSPSDLPAAEPLADLYAKMIAALEQEIRDKEKAKDTEDIPLLKQKLRLLQLVADRPDDAVDQVEQLPAAEREAFKQLMFALTTWLSPEDAKRASSRNAKVLRALHEVNNRLSAVSKLDLKNLMFCEKVESFGWYTEFPRAEFLPKQQVILYVEVQNFAAEEKTASAFETELQGSYQIYDVSGNIVDEHQLPLDREVCRNFRRDYFLAYRVHLPADIAPGRYRLELTLEDLKAKSEFKGRKQGEAMIEFAIK